MVLQMVDACQIQRIRVCGTNGVFRPRCAAPLPLEVVAGRDDAASLAHAVFEHGLLRSGFRAGVDDGATVGEGVAPAHGKGLDILLPAVRQHRDNIGGEDLAGGFQPFRRLFAVQFVNHPAEFIGQVILGDVVATTHGQFPLSDGCTV